MVFKSLTTPAMEGAARGILCLDAVRVIVSPNVVEGRGEGGIGAVEGELILSACVVDDRGEGGWERKTYHAGEASASADRRMKQNAARGNARNPPLAAMLPPPPACSAPACSAPRNQLPGGSTRQCFDAGGQGGAPMRRRGGINEGRGGGAAERRKQKGNGGAVSKKKGNMGCGWCG